MADVVACIDAAVPGAEITWSGDPLPFPAALEAVGFDREVGPFPRTSLADGVAATIAHFRRTANSIRPDIAASRAAAALLRLERSRAPAGEREQREELGVRNAAASQSTALNDPVASRTAPRMKGDVAAMV